MDVFIHCNPTSVISRARIYMKEILSKYEITVTKYEKNMKILL